MELISRAAPGRSGDSQPPEQSPFQEQANNRQQYQLLLHQIEQLLSATSPDTLREEIVRSKAAAEAATDDWILQEELARLQKQSGDLAGAVESWQRVVGLLPHAADAWQSLGLALAAVKRDDEAISAFQQATRLHPESVVSMNSLAELYAHEGHPRRSRRASFDRFCG